MSDFIIDNDKNGRIKDPYAYVKIFRNISRDKLKPDHKQIGKGRRFIWITIITEGGEMKLVNAWILHWESTGVLEIVPDAYLEPKLKKLYNTGIRYTIRRS